MRIDVGGESIDLSRRQVCTALALGAIAAALPSPSTAQAETGGFRTLDFDWSDDDRCRAVPARLYLPLTDMSASVPLVVFSHGMGGSRRGYSYLGKYWASRGIGSLHVQHVGSDSAVWRGNPFEMTGRLRNAAQETEAIHRVRDVSFALDRVLQFPSEEIDATIDTRRLAVAGHSYGAMTSLLAVGARVEREDRQLDLSDPRFSAAVVISAPPFYGEKDLAAILSAVRVPTLHVTAADDVISLPGYYSGAQDRISVFEGVTDPRKMLVVYKCGSHSMFTDRAVTGGPLLNPKVKAATQALSLAYLRFAFDDSRVELEHWGREWSRIVAEQVWPPSAWPAGRTSPIS